jgi:hypothetical protein
MQPTEDIREPSSRTPRSMSFDYMTLAVRPELRLQSMPVFSALQWAAPGSRTEWIRQSVQWGTRRTDHLPVCLFPVTSAEHYCYMPAIEGSPFCHRHCAAIIRCAEAQLSLGLAVKIEFKLNSDVAALSKDRLRTLQHCFSQPTRHSVVDFEFKTVGLKRSTPMLVEQSFRDLNNTVFVEGGVDHGFETREAMCDALWAAIREARLHKDYNTDYINQRVREVVDCYFEKYVEGSEPLFNMEEIRQKIISSGYVSDHSRYLLSWYGGQDRVQAEFRRRHCFSRPTRHSAMDFDSKMVGLKRASSMLIVYHNVVENWTSGCEYFITNVRCSFCADTSSTASTHREVSRLPCTHCRGPIVRPASHSRQSQKESKREKAALLLPCLVCRARPPRSTCADDYISRLCCIH